MTNDEEKELRRRFVDAKLKLEEAVSWRERADASFKRAETELYQVMEDMLDAARAPVVRSTDGGAK